jgi:hypothetical protein
MPMYFFVIKRDRKSPTANFPGLELADMDAAWEEATKTAGEMIRDLDGAFKPGSELSIEIRNASHKLLRTVTLVAASHE